MDTLSATDYATTFERELSLNAPRENKTGSLNVYLYISQFYRTGVHMLHKDVFMLDIA